MITHPLIGRQGRLGNQLYQYAMLQGVSAKRGYEVGYPTPYTQTDVPSPDGSNALAAFSLTGTKIDTNPLPYSYDEQGKGGTFQPEVFDQPDGTAYKGWFQSWKYFAHCEERVRREFQFRKDIYEAAIHEHPAWCGPLVSVVVRRGDYLVPPHNTYFTQLTERWYRLAMGRFSDQNTFMFVSDDIAWCRYTFDGTHPRCIFFDSGNHWIDLCMVTMCQHHIIANSSFAWWGAWLNPSPTKRVIAPSEWYQPGQHPTWSRTDHIPLAWEMLDDPR